MKCEITADNVDFTVDYTVNGGTGFCISINDDDIEINSAKIGDQDIIDVLSDHCLDSIEESVWEYHKDDREWNEVDDE